MIHLDTSYLIRATRPGTSDHAQMQQWLRTDEELAVSVVALAEFHCGPLTAEQAELVAITFPTPEPFLAEDAPRAAALFNAGGRRRGSLTDCMIAAIAIRNGAALATENPADFRRFVPLGLRLL